MTWGGEQWRKYERRLCSKLKALFKKSHLKAGAQSQFAWALSIVTLVISISLVASTGPSIQHYIFSLINSDAPSIYGSAYQDGLIKFPELQEWLIVGLHWPFLLIALFIVLLSLRHSSSRELFISSGLASFWALLMYDLLIGLFDHRLAVGYVLENIIADAIGGAALGLVFVTIATVANLCYVYVRGRKQWRQFVAGLAAIVVGTCSSAATFYVAKFFYRPIPVKLDVVLDYPSSGTLISESNLIGDKTRDLQKNAEVPPFQFFPKNIDDSVIHWNGRGDDKLLVQWNSHSKSEAFDLIVELYADCINDEIDSAKSVAKNTVHIRNVTSLSISLDAGFSNFKTANPGKLSGRLATDFGSPSTFSLDRDMDTKKTKITQFVQKQATMKIWNGTRSLSFFVNALLANSTDQGIVLSARELRFKINGNDYSVRSEKPRREIDDALLTCKTLEPNGAINKDRTTISGAHSYFGALVRINKRTLPESIYVVDNNELKVAGGNGWVTLTRTDDMFEAQHESGTANLIAFKGNIASLDIDRSSASTRPTDEYVAFGELNGRYESSAKVHFSGEAKALWKNRARVNPTKWERLGWEQRLYILTIIISMLGPIGGYILIQIKKDVDIDWLSSLKSSP